jgi:hypothetical protein
MSASVASPSNFSTVSPSMPFSSKVGLTSTLAVKVNALPGTTSSCSKSSIATRPTGLISFSRHASPK